MGQQNTGGGLTVGNHKIASIFVCLCMFALREGAGGTGLRNGGLESAASFAVQSAGFQPAVRRRPANLLSQAETHTVPERAARQHCFLRLICQQHRMNALSHKATKRSVFAELKQKHELKQRLGLFG